MRHPKRKGTRKGTPWTAFVKKIYTEMKKKNPNVKLGAAMKEASRRKSEMK
jgi:adenosine/AMP kinase